MPWLYSGLSRILHGTVLVGCLLGLAPLAWGTSCSTGTVACAGPYGTGCYNPAYATCYNGVICARGSTPCVGRYGAGCYNPAYATCSDGLICSRPLQPCLGRFGAQCYAPGQATCETNPAPLPGRREQRSPGGPGPLQRW